jgi:RNA polymerase sigma factor (sigma-70 family)
LLPSVLGKLYGDFYPQVRSWFAAKQASEQNADDLTEQVFVELVRGDTPDDPKAYIATIASNVLSQYRRRKVKERTALHRLLAEAIGTNDAPQMHEPGESSADEELLSKHEAVMEDVLIGLPPGQVELLRLRFVDCLRVAELARRVGRSRDAAYKRLQRIVQQLRRKHAIAPNRPKKPQE